MRLALALQASGVEPGDRVAYLMPNLPEMLIAHYAVPLAGGVLVAVNTRLTAEEVGYMLQHSGAKIVVVDAALLATAAAAANGIEAVAQLVVAEDAELPPAGAELTAEPRLVSYSEFLARGMQEPLPWSVSDELAPIAINYTSGTTGRPRGVIYTHRGAYLNSFGEIIHSRHDENSVYLWTLPMFHCNGWCTPWSLTAIGGTHGCLREVRGDAIWEQLREHNVTHLNAAPTVVSTILNVPEAGPLTRPVLITTAGAPPSPTTIAHMERMGFQIVHVYGLTETYGLITVCQPQPQWAGLPSDERAVLQARQGVGMIQAEGVRVVDAEMADVPADGSTMGEIVMHGNNVMAGYYLDPDATAEAFRGGWFHSGDLGVMHPDGYIELRDRSKDVVISGGENISTIEVEQALMSHPAVLEAAVIGIPDDKWGERPKAFVLLLAGQSATPLES
jgi:fatty-acyl-CoA synthase